jgi:hypothetical protein
MARPIDPVFSLFAAAARPSAKPRPAPTSLFDYGDDGGADNFVRGLLGFEQDPRSPRFIRPSDVFRGYPVQPNSQQPVVKQQPLPQVRQAPPAREPLEADGLTPGVDWDFIGLNEGNGTEIDVPHDEQGVPVGNSGVTVAHGFDLGAQDLTALEAYKFPPDLIAKLKPYLGLRRETAMMRLNEMRRKKLPLTLTEAEQSSIDQKVRTKAYEDTRTNFDNSATGGVKFDDLADEAKTVLVDLWFQYPHPATSIPKFWGHATSGRWRDAYRELNNFGDNYGRRRGREAKRLNRAIQSGKLK